MRPNHFLTKYSERNPRPLGRGGCQGLGNVKHAIIEGYSF